MDKVLEKKDCCGCHACFSICPVQAIYMEEDNKGFKYPVINPKKCINCGMCKKVCPVLNSQEKEKKLDVYACYNQNLDERMKSSSGGIFILLAKEIIKRNGAVFGALFDKNFNLIHDYVETIEDLKKLQGSKYTQSTIGDAYKKTKEFLDNGRLVLFTGTPCQIEGLKAYLMKEYDNLYTQDIICHGVPSPKVFSKYMTYQEKINNEKIKELSFRNKEFGWSRFETKIMFETKTYHKSHGNDLYMQAFLKNICLRDSCYHCSFKKKYRISDITLADYWGIDNIHPEINDDKGISLVLINSPKGRELFNYIKKNTVYKKTNLDEAVKYNSAFNSSVNHSTNEKEFIENIDKMDFKHLVNKYVPRRTLTKRIISKLKQCIKKIIKK